MKLSIFRCVCLLAIALGFCLCDKGLWEDNLDTRVRRLTDLSNANPVIKLNYDNFRTFAQLTPRNYSIVLILVALSSHHGCGQCREAVEQFRIVANSWKHSKQHNNELFFALADFDESQGIFESLNLRTAPAILHVVPKGVIQQSDYMGIHHVGYSAHSIAEWIKSRTSIQIRVLYPPSYTGTLLLAMFMTVGGVALWYRRISTDYLSNPTMWGVLSLGIIFCGISGQVYNQIRGPPLLHATREGEIKALIYPGSDYQFVAETLIVMALYIMATLGIILIDNVQRISGPGKRKMYLLGGGALFTVAFSLVLFVFRRKYQGYPYSFLFK